MNRYNTSNDGNAFIDIDDGNHYSTIFIATFSASSKYDFDTHKKNPIGKKAEYDVCKVYKVHSVVPFLSIGFIKLTITKR